MARLASRFDTSFSSWAPPVDGCERLSVTRGVQVGSMAVACDLPELTELTEEKTIKFYLVSCPVIPFEDSSCQHWDLLAEIHEREYVKASVGPSSTVRFAQKT